MAWVTMLQEFCSWCQFGFSNLRLVLTAALEKKGSRLHKYKTQMPLEEPLSARGTGARQSALFIGRIRGRPNAKDLGQLTDGIHHNAVGIAFVGSLNASREIAPSLKSPRLSKSNSRASLTTAPLFSLCPAPNPKAADSLQSGYQF